MTVQTFHSGASKDQQQQFRRIICKILTALAVGVSATQKVESERKEIEETKERAGKYEGKDAARVGFT